MNLRELWDTVVLRDILGYIFPGCVTLFAVALALKAATGLHPADMVDSIVDYLQLEQLSEGLGTPWNPWVLAAAVVPISYALGHLQAWALDLAEDHVRSWNLGALALAHLKRESLGDEYVRQGCARFCGRHGRASLSPLVRYLRRIRKPHSKKHVEGATKVRRQRIGHVTRGRQRQAGDLWRLCDRYVFHEDRDIHSMFMGRYYVLAVLFSNLGTSLVVLGVSILLTWLPSERLAQLTTVGLVTGLGAVLKLCQPVSSAQCWYRRHASELYAFVILALLALFASLKPLTTLAALVPTGAGGLLILRSGYFRMRFVECTFPIFYAIARGDESKDNVA